MRPAVSVAILCLLAASRQCPAQFTDDFEDGDLTTETAWFGDVNRFVLEQATRGWRLRSDGVAQADTLLLWTESSQSFGTWKFNYGYRDGKPTSFNHARVILSRPRAEESDAIGYALQLGSNDGSIRLYSFRGDISDRQLLRASEPDVLSADSLDRPIRVERDYRGRWTVLLDNVPVLTHEATADFSERSESFALWIKHTANRGGSHWFDDFEVYPGIESDVRSPSVLQATAVDRFRIAVRFDEPLASADACRVETYLLLPAQELPASTDCLGRPYTDSLIVVTTKPVKAGDELLIQTVADPSGNTSSNQTIPVDISAVQYFPNPNDVVVNEIDFAPAPAEAEFVELFNRSGRSVDLSTLELTDGGTSARIASSTLLIRPGDFAVITRDATALGQRHPDVVAIQPAGWPVLNNSGDLVALVAGQDTIDAVTFQSDWASAGGSLERVNPELPSDFPGNWESATDGRGGTPGAVNSVFAIDQAGPEVMWAAQKPGDQQLVFVQFSEYVAAGSLNRSDFLLDGNVAADLLPSLHRYQDSAIIRFDEVGPGDFSARDLQDVAGNVSPPLTVRLRLQPTKGSFAINELLFDPVADAFDGRPDQPEFIEVRNVTSEPLDLSSCVVSGPANEHGDRDLLNIDSPDAALLPNNFMTIVARGEVRSLIESFPDVSEDAVVKPVRESSLRLLNDGMTVTIECPDAGVIDSVTYQPEWHNDSVPVHRGRSLERIDPIGPSNSPLNWSTSAAAYGASPGRPNSITSPPLLSNARAHDLIVTEVMYEPRTDAPSPQFEYVEIRNRSDRPIDINGFMIATDADANASKSVRIAYGPTVVAPRQFALVANGPGADSTNVETYLTHSFPSLMGSAATTTVLRRRKLSLPNGGTELLLLDSDGLRIDAASYSPDWHHPHLAATRGISLERISETVSGRHPSNWSSSVDPEGGTPGRENSIDSGDHPGHRSLEIAPSPFFPDRDGNRDHTVIRFTLTTDRPMVRVTIFDSRGRTVRHLSRATITSASHAMVWDGADDRGLLVRPGIYVIHVEATDIGARSVEEVRGVVVVGS